MPFFNRSLAGEKSAHHASISGLSVAAGVSWLHFHSELSLKIVHFLSYTENTMFILNFCCDFLKSIFHFPVQFLNFFA